MNFGGSTILDNSGIGRGEDVEIWIWSEQDGQD